MSVEHRRPPHKRAIPEGQPGKDPFGDVLPDRTRDEEAEARGNRSADGEDQLRREVPPHHA
jgi:hypothetical protein